MKGRTSALFYTLPSVAKIHPPYFMQSTTYTLRGGLTLNRLGFGAMRIVGPGVWGPSQDHDEVIRVLQRAVALGVNFIDTADSYGPNVSEELIAEALYPYKPGLVIGTKGGFMRTGPNQWHINSHPDHLAHALEGSLKRLKLDATDLYQLHRIDPTVPRKDTFRFLQRAQEEGLIRHIGLSEVSIDDIKAAADYFEVVSVQNKYSFDFRKWEPELEYCREQDIAFIPWNPLNANNAQTMAGIERIAQKNDTTPHLVALAWLLQHAENILLIPGTSKVAHLEMNMKAAEVRLDEEDIKALDGSGGLTT
jgi:pyridoxine 4-dehydrogenase